MRVSASALLRYAATVGIAVGPCFATARTSFGDWASTKAGLRQRTKMTRRISLDYAAPAPGRGRDLFPNLQFRLGWPGGTGRNSGCLRPLRCSGRRCRRSIGSVSARVTIRVRGIGSRLARVGRAGHTGPGCTGSSWGPRRSRGSWRSRRVLPKNRVCAGNSQRE